MESWEKNHINGRILQSFEKLSETSKCPGKGLNARVGDTVVSPEDNACLINKDPSPTHFRFTDRYFIRPFIDTLLHLESKGMGFLLTGI